MPRTGKFSAIWLQWPEAEVVCTFVLQFFNDIWQNYESIFVETTWVVYREEYLSEFKWNCYLTSKKFALTEIAIELKPF